MQSVRGASQHARLACRSARSRNTQIPYGLISVSFRAEIVGYAAVGLRAYFAQTYVYWGWGNTARHSRAAF